VRLEDGDVALSHPRTIASQRRRMFGTSLALQLVALFGDLQQDDLEAYDYHCCGQLKRRGITELVPTMLANTTTMSQLSFGLIARILPLGLVL
jgi:hypothetical protein